MKKQTPIVSAPQIKWTLPRKLVYEALSCQSKPQTAYQLIEFISHNNQHHLKPPSVYRALQFLEKIGLSVKVEGLNAYMLCRDQNHDKHHVFYVCNNCGDTKESCNKELNLFLQQQAKTQGFKTTKQIIELHGACKTCQ